MRWFKHMSRSNFDDRMTQLLTECGTEGYGFYWLLLESIAERLEPTGYPTLTLTLPQWSRILYSHHNRVSKYLGKLGVIGLVKVEYVESGIRVSVPNLLKYRDEYTEKSRYKPDSVTAQSTEAEYRVQSTDKTHTPNARANGTHREATSPKAFRQAANGKAPTLPGLGPELPVARADPSQALATRQQSDDAFQEFIGVFLAAGKPLNDRDLEKALRCWLSYEPAEHALIMAHVVPAMSDGTYSDVMHTPMPARYLEAQPWRRKGIERVLPRAPASKAETGQRKAEENFLRKRGLV